MHNKDITIVEYTPKLAASVAIMWNNTTEGWNGDDWSTTTENVLAKESASAHINLFLAVDSNTINDAEPKVVGYCKLTKDHDDENALYIALLSVLPTYFNKKVGKALVLESVKRTIELKYPKLYLYTWSGNTRAVPLYKKCGFFWKQGNEVHLVNMIPSVLECEAVKDFFQTAFWYNDSTREIIIEPDGRIENKFEYFAYNWEKDGRKLSMQYCQKGKGLRRIDCEDYTITATVSNRDLIFGKKHKINYEIINKSGKPLTVELTGMDNKNIRFDYQAEANVASNHNLSAEFMVDPIEKVQNPDTTHPVVHTRININGKLAEFKTGIVPKHPVAVSLQAEKSFYYDDAEGQAYINLENFSEEKVNISFDLCNCEVLSFVDPHITTDLEPLEKKSIPVSYKIISGGRYNQKAEIKVSYTNCSDIRFNKNLTSRFFTHSSHDFQETDSLYEASLGRYRVNVCKRDHACNSFFVDVEKDDQNIYNMPPRLGSPYSSEFDQLEAEKVISYDEKDALVLKADYKSQDFPGIAVTVYYRIHADGIMEKWLDITNNRSAELDENFGYCDRFDFSFQEMVIPYDNKLIKFQHGVDNTLDNYNCDRITENWLFAGFPGRTAGVTWPSEYKIKRIDWNLGFEHNLQGLKPGATMTTKPLTFFLNTFDLDHFRRYVAKNSKIETKNTIKTSDLFINDGNPFVSGDLKIELRDCKNQTLKAEISVKSPTGLFEKQTLIVKDEDKLSTATINLPMKSQNLIEAIRSDVRYTSQQIGYNKKVFPLSSDAISLTTGEDQGKTVYTVDNGIIQFKASPDFAPTLYSLVHNGREWSDSSFPQTISKCWWTPWYGGLYANLFGICEKESLEENISTEFVTIQDNFKNSWQGLKIVIKVVKKEEIKGLIFEQYFLTLPGTPVLVNFNKLINRSGKFRETGFYKIPFLKVGENIKDCYWEYLNRDNDLCRYYMGRECTNITVEYDKIHSLNSDETKDRMFFFHAQKPNWVEICANESTIPKVVEEPIKLADQESFVSPYEFMIFAQEQLEYKELADLRNIKFE